jgi:lipoprotein-releasing system permease protein
MRGKRSANAVPILSRISMVAIAVSSAAMIIIFSVFNGLESVVKDTYKAFYPDLKISPIRGKFFPVDTAYLHRVRGLTGVRDITTVIEDKVFAVNNDQQNIITLKGIENNYLKVNDLEQYLLTGSADTVSMGHPYTAIAGEHILNQLGTDINTLSYIVLNYANPEVINPGADPMSAIISLKLHPAGVFRVSDEFDSKYVLAPLPLVQTLFHQAGHCSAIEIKADQPYIESLKEQLGKLAGKGYKVETRFEQNKTMYMVMGAEKWAVFAILVLVLLIATFNMVGALAMLVLQKQKDIAILKAMGAQPSTIRSVFLLEGVLWSLTGGLAGIIIGSGVCLLQQKFGFIKLGGSFLVDAYPVKIQAPDILLVITTILTVGLLVSWYPALRSTRAVDPSLKST